MVRFRAMVPEDAVALAVQPNQAIGFAGPVNTLEHGEQLCAGGEAWAAIGDDGALLGVAGFAETFPGAQGVAWALLALDKRGAMVAMTRFARARIADSPLRRIEAIVRAEDHGCTAWAAMVGLRLVAALHRWGLHDETHLLFERVR